MTVHDVVEEDGRPWIVMQLVRADALDAVVAREGPLPPDRVAAIGLDLLDALSAAHAAEVVHRDVKPGNVLLPRGRAVLTDFGIATVAGDETLTQAGAIVGSPAYLAPEQARHQKATPASDLWSLGATLYAAVEGRPPYNRPDVWGVMAAVLSDDPDPIERAGPLTPVLQGLLRKDPGRRISPDEAGRLLRQAARVAAPHAAAPPPFVPPDPGRDVTLRPRDVTPPSPVAPPTVETPAQKRTPWPLIIPAGVFTAALVAAVITVVVFTSQGDGPEGKGRAGGAGTSSSSPSTAVPDGYRLYRGPAFVVAVPKGWKESGSGDDVTFTDQTEGVQRGIAIQRIASAGDPGDGLADAIKSMRYDPQYPEFVQEKFLRNVPYQGGDAADLQFTFSKDGTLSRCLVRVFEFDGAIYQTILVGGQKNWDEGLPYYEMFLKTLRKP